eukprot:NODE_3127_length_1418_cov_40.210039_g2716_i0.p1 GENE.NODE_3127_length_1418_cov_40.210039_g2716_i0~~NODE_3127_length_1418_cov_40.210039_g2716_i0.p1  ORF type:complete len:404 (-),score=62.48 NODE_3127_length_1418_cov_40.210039_g2716_i0:146-1357(-)
MNSDLERALHGKAYPHVQRIRTDVLRVLSRFPLKTLSGNFVEKDGTTHNNLLYLSGTIPISYQNFQYNIPITIWLRYHYPQQPPIFYVTPTPTMMIKQNHRYVDLEGMCYHEYISSWKENTHNLLDLIDKMSIVFSSDPPVYSRPASMPYNPSPKQYAPPPSQNLTTSYPPVQPNSVPLNSFINPNPFPQDPKTLELNNLRNELTAKIQSLLPDLDTQFNHEYRVLEASQIQLQHTAKEQSLLHSSCLSERDRLVTHLNQLLEDNKDLSSWLSTNSGNKEIDIDAETNPKSPLALQLYELIAEDLAIEDTIYHLDKQLGEGNLDCETWIKNVRQLGRVQFQARALMIKVEREIEILKATVPSPLQNVPPPQFSSAPPKPASSPPPSLSQWLSSKPSSPPPVWK